MENDYSKFTDDELAELLAKAEAVSGPLWAESEAAKNRWCAAYNITMALRGEKYLRAQIAARQAVAA